MQFIRPIVKRQKQKLDLKDTMEQNGMDEKKFEYKSHQLWPWHFSYLGKEMSRNNEPHRTKHRDESWHWKSPPRDTSISGIMFE